MQVIVAKEWLPALIGRQLPQYTGYKSWVNPGLSNAFATAAYRIGHSMVGDDIDLLDEHFQVVGGAGVGGGVLQSERDSRGGGDRAGDAVLRGEHPAGGPIR